MSSPLLGSIAKVYLLKEGDERNVCYVNNKQLLIIRKNVSTRIDLELIKGITFSNKKFLFPLITGGVLMPFFFIALFNNIFHHYISLIGFLIGVYLFYFGYVGSSSMVVLGHQPIKEFFLPSISPNLKAFAKFVNEKLLQNKEDEQFYHYWVMLEPEQIQKLKDGHNCTFKDGIELLPVKGTVQPEHKKHIRSVRPVVIDIRSLNGNLSYDKSKHESLSLNYKGDISQKDVVSDL